MSRMKLIGVRWPIIIASLVLMVAYVPYVVDLVLGRRLSEGYGMVMTGIMVALLIAVLSVLPFTKKRVSEGRTVLAIALATLVLPFTGPRIAPVVLIGLAAFLMIREVVTSGRERPHG